MKRSITNNTTSVPSTSSSSAADSACKYEVFLSFRGKDTREGFTDFLYTYLVSAAICTFRDDNELRIGEEIGPDLLKAINDSKISIPIFSKNYASSKWCLRELAEMVECHTNEGQMIFPIFYDIEPSDVRNQKRSYEEAFRRHEKDFDETTVKRWKDAMTTVGNLKGWELKKETKGHEGELVKMVVEKVVLELKKNYTHVPNNLVGMDHHVEEMERLLDFNSNGVRIVGIHGMGGIGKTTISKVIYNQLCDRFECCCFLDEVRERSRYHNGVVFLQNELVSKILKQQFFGINNDDEGIDKVKDVVRKKKILLVLDDIDRISQFDKLVGKCSWFGVGSRIVVTTRDKKVLNTLEAACQKDGLNEAYKSYEPQLMNDDHSLQLFSKYAFIQDFPPEDYTTLSKDIVSTAAGLPLVLVTIGSVLFANDDKDLWEEILRKLQRIPHKEVLDKLRLSFEALDYEQQQIFLDIACLFVGKDKANPYYMWEDCEFFPRNGINTLVLRSLVKVGDDNTLRMHDQLRDLGRQIVREGNLSKPGEYSRVWRPDEALQVLKGGLGTRNVEALNLDLRAVKKDEYEQLELLREAYEHTEFVEIEKQNYIRRLVTRDFSLLPNIRFLRLGYAFLDGNFQHIFSNLRWLEWRCSEKFTPTNLKFENLVILDMSKSTITDNWKGWAMFKVAKKLKVLNLLGCTGLVRGPNFSMFASLEILNLSYTSLREINPSLADLMYLRTLDLSYCNISKLDCSTFMDLESLNLHSCKSLLEVRGLESSVSLTNLKASECASLRTIGDLSNLKRLKEVDISYCLSLADIQGLENMESLENLYMMWCKSIVILPNLSNLGMLKKLFLSDWDKLVKVEGLGGLVNVEHLEMSWCNHIERLPGLSNLKMLKRLDLHNCKTLHEIEGLSGLVSLTFFNMMWCESIVSLPDLSKLRKLRKLILSSCRKLHEIDGLGDLVSLEHLDLRLCSSMERLPDLSNLKNLKTIDLSSCKKLADIEGLRGLVLLRRLDLSNCTSLHEIRGLEELKSLEVLDVTDCEKVKWLPNFSNFENLKTLNAGGIVRYAICGLTELKKRHCRVQIQPYIYSTPFSQRSL